MDVSKLKVQGELDFLFIPVVAREKGSLERKEGGSRARFVSPFFELKTSD